jgi:hypothetical protein
MMNEAQIMAWQPLEEPGGGVLSRQFSQKHAISQKHHRQKYLLAAQHRFQDRQGDMPHCVLSRLLIRGKAFSWSVPWSGIKGQHGASETMAAAQRLDSLRDNAAVGF